VMLDNILNAKDGKADGRREVTRSFQKASANPPPNKVYEQNEGCDYAGSQRGESESNVKDGGL